MSEDPLQFKGSGVNWYANDPSGMCGPNCAGALWGALAGGTGGGIVEYQADGVWGAVKGTGIGAVVGAGTGFFNPILSRQVGAVAAAGIVGATSSASGQIAANFANEQPLGTNFSYFAVGGAAFGNGLAIVPARLAGTFAGEAAGVSIPFGSSRSLTIVTPSAVRSAGVTKSLTEGGIGGVFEAGGDEIGKEYFSSPSVPFGGGAAVPSVSPSFGPGLLV